MEKYFVEFFVTLQLFFFLYLVSKIFKIFPLSLEEDKYKDIKN